MSTTNTVMIKSMRSGGYCPAHPAARAGATSMTYAITGVPADISASAVAQQMGKMVLAHSLDDPTGWRYDWVEIAGRRQGSIINRYKQQRAWGRRP